MILTTQMKDMKIYKTPMYLPTVDGDKKKGSAILLLTPNYNSSKKVMNHPMTVNKLRYSSYYLNPDVSYYIKGKVTKGKEQEEYIKEATIYDMYQNLSEMSATERNKLKDSDFGLPSKRKYPLDSEAHVKSAIKFFNYVDKEDEEELAKNIFKAIKKQCSSKPAIGDKNRLKNYMPKNYITENWIKSTEDIYYNKEAFDKGDINICFITGHSGSGKSTMAASMKNVELYELDDVWFNKEKFTMENMKEYGDLIYGFFNGVGKKYWYTKDDVKDGKAKPVDNYEEHLIKDFVKYALAYANSHKKTKFVFEGVWIYFFMEPSEFDKCAVYIKGTSKLKSDLRASNRDGENFIDKAKMFGNKVFNSKKMGMSAKEQEEKITKWRNHFKSLMDESALLEGYYSDTGTVYNTYHVTEFDDNFKAKGNKRLSNFKREELDVLTWNKYKDDSPILKDAYPYIRKENKGYIFTDKNGKFVAFVAVDYRRDYNWITGLDVADDYKGYGLGKQLFDVAVDELEGDAITVSKNNEVLMKICKARKFESGHTNRYLTWMFLDETAIVDEGYSNLDKDLFKDYKPYIIDKEEGFTSKDGIYNSIVWIKGINEPMRGRSEVLIFDGNKVLLSFCPDGSYVVPGGSFDKNEDHAKTAKREAKEEVRVNCKDVTYVDSFIVTKPKAPEWVVKNIPKDKRWKSYYTEIYVATATGEYKGKIDDEDKDDMIETAKFYPISKVYKSLRPEHKKAVDFYTKKVIVREDTKDYSALDNRISFSGLYSEVAKLSTIFNGENLYKALEQLDIVREFSDIPMIQVMTYPTLTKNYFNNTERVNENGDTIKYVRYRIRPIKENEDFEQYACSVLETLYLGLLESKYPSSVDGTQNMLPFIVTDYLTGANSSYNAYGKYLFEDGAMPLEFFYASMCSGDIDPVFEELSNNFAIEKENLMYMKFNEGFQNDRVYKDGKTYIDLNAVKANWEEMDKANGVTPPEYEDGEEPEPLAIGEVTDLPSDSYLQIGNTVTLFESATNDNKLRQLLFNGRIKQRAMLVPMLNKVKEDNEFIKFAYPDILKYKDKNVFVDLYYYNELFFRNNTWVGDKGYRLYMDLLARMLNDPAIKSYKLQTVFIPIADWNIHKVAKMWMYKQSINPISCIYHMLEKSPEDIKTTFKNRDVIFFSKDRFFKINFSKIEEPAKLAIKFRMFIQKLLANQEFDPEDVDTSYDNGSSEATKAAIIDKIEDTKGVDLTKNVKTVEDRHKVQNQAIEKDGVFEPVKDLENVPSGASTQTTGKNTDNKVNADKEIADKEIAKGTDLSKVVGDEIDKEQFAELIDQISKEYDNPEEAIDAMDQQSDEVIKQIAADLADLGSDTVKIDATRAARMNKLDQQFRDSTINNKSVRDLLEEEKNKPLPTTELPVSSPNHEWKEMTYMNFDKDYDMDRDIVACFYHFTKTHYHPVAIRKLDVVDNSTSEDELMLYTCEMEDAVGNRFTIKLDIPIMKNHRMKLRGNLKSISSQLYNMPIIKTETDTCQIVTNYQKIFIRTYNTVTGRSMPHTAKLIKALEKYEGKDIKVIYGNCSKVCDRYDVPVDYEDISTVISYIETKHRKFYFDQDEIRMKYPEIDDSHGVPYAVTTNDRTGKEAIQYYNMVKGRESLSLTVAQQIGYDAPGFEELFMNAKPSSSGMYSRCSILNNKIPLVIICAYLEGLETTLKKADVFYRITDKLSKEDRESINRGYCSSIRFEDGYLVYNTGYDSSMLLNGLAVSGCDRFSIGEINNRNTYLEILEMYGGKILADGLENFYDCLVDPITYENLLRYKLPTDFVSILLYANVLLCDNKFIKHSSTISRRARKAELIAAYTYEALSESYGTYARMMKHNSNNASMTIKQSAVIDKILANPTSSDASVINALDDVETTNAFSYKGKAGMNEARSYTLDKRMYDDSMINVLGMSTSYSANVSLTRQATLNMNVDSSRGYIKSIDGDVSKMNAANTLSATEALTPFGTTRDDAPRTLMTFAQTSEHMVITEESDPLLVTNGADEALAYMTTDKFVHKAKRDGKIVEMTDNYIIVEYSDTDREYIDLTDSIEKNSNAGYYISIKLDVADGLKVGSKIKEGQIVAYHKKSFSNSLGESDNIAYNIGKIAWVAIMNTANGFEDSGICSERLARELKTIVVEEDDHVLEKDTNVYKIAKVGDHVEPEDPLMIWSNPHDEEDANELMRVLGDNKDEDSTLGRRVVRSNVSGIVKDIKVFRTVDIDELSPSLQKIVRSYEAPIKQQKKKMEEYGISTKTLPATYKLEPVGKLKNAVDAVRIEFYLEREDIMSVGDKITYYSANKAIIKDIVPDEIAPYTDERPNEIIDAFVSETSIDKRMVTSTLNYGGIQKVMILLDRFVKKMIGIRYDETKI